jgi:hypothetical protein
MSEDTIERLAALANADQWLVHRGRFLDVTFLLQVGDVSYLVRIHKGRIESLDKGPFIQPRWTFALRGSEAAWETHWQPLPPPGFHDLIALIKTKALTLEGDQYPFMANLRYFKDLLSIPRAAAPRTAAGGSR